MSASEIRWGILGPGHIAGLFAEDLAQTPGARGVAVASRDHGRAHSFAATHDIARAHGSYAALAADPEVDIVYIASPHSHHFAHAKMMLEAGKPVLLEKPFAMSAAEGEALVALARERGLFLMDAMWTLCNPLLQSLLARVRGGAIGTPQAFSALLGPIGVPEGHRVGDPALGGSYIKECLVYPLNILAALAPGLMQGAKVSASSVRNARGVDTSASIQLAAVAGVATMSGGFVIGSKGAGPSGFHLIGDKGWLCVTDNLFNPAQAQISTATGVEDLTEPASAGRYRWEIEEAGRCLRDGLMESLLVPHDLTLAVLNVLDQASAVATGKAMT